MLNVKISSIIRFMISEGMISSKLKECRVQDALNSDEKYYLEDKIYSYNLTENRKIENENFEKNIKEKLSNNSDSMKIISLLMFIITFINLLATILNNSLN